MFLPTNISQINLVIGHIPTNTTSGSGNGFTYDVTGTTATITFTQKFYSTPVIIAIGQYSLGASTVTIKSASATTVELEFSAGTEIIHFEAKEFL